MRDLLTIAKMRAILAMREFRDSLKEERGDTNFVAIIVIILIIMVIAVIFQKQLKGAVEAVFQSLSGFISGNVPGTFDNSAKQIFK